MARERYVVLGLAHPRSPWFPGLARLATASALPLEFVKCVSGEELRARLAGGRPFSAAVVDGGLSAVDRDLVDVAAQAGCAVVVVTDGRGGRDWTALGAAAVLAPDFDAGELLDVLARHARLIARGDGPTGLEPVLSAAPAWRGRLLTVTGAGGTGSSTVAVALAEGLAVSGRDGRVLLADLALHAEQAVLHDAPDVVPGAQELVEAHRTGRPSPEEVRSLTFDVEERGYHLLLGLRRHRDWAALRPRAVEAAVDGLLRAYDLVVADVDPDVEGQDECGSVEVEERNLLARTCTRLGDVVVVVGTPGVKGVHALARLLAELQGSGVAPERLLPVVNHAPRNPRQRAALARAVVELSGAPRPHLSIGAPLFLPTRRRVDDAFRDGTRLPAGLAAPLAGAVSALLARLTPSTVEPERPVPVAPGALGSWTDHGAAG